MFVLSQDLVRNAKRLLNRPLKRSDGLSGQRIEAEQKRLGINLPVALRTLYTAVGSVRSLMCSFVQIAVPEQLKIEDGKLVFAEENQGVCTWGVDYITETVYQKNNGVWLKEQAGLSAFLSVLLFYNCAQGGYPHSAFLPMEEFLRRRKMILETYEKAVEYNGIWIYFQRGQLLWGFRGESEEFVYLSCFTEALCSRSCALYGFAAL